MELSLDCELLDPLLSLEPLELLLEEPAHTRSHISGQTVQRVSTAPPALTRRQTSGRQLEHSAEPSPAQMGRPMP